MAVAKRLDCGSFSTALELWLLLEFAVANAYRHSA
jgi:hypothetical protein